MLDEISSCYLDMAKAISQTQDVIIACYNSDHRQHIRSLCQKHGCDMRRIVLIVIESNDTWVRDFGPQLLLGNKEYQYLDLEFNAWGEQYACRLDNLFAETLFNLAATPRCHYHRCPLVVEGGNLEFDSNACLLTNIACIKRNMKNEQCDTDELIQRIKQELSVKRVLTVDVPPLSGDDTGGHIDTLARFIDDETIVYASCHDSNHPDHACLLQLQTQLRSLTTKQGTPYRLIPLPVPKKSICLDEDHYAPASYVNFVFINGKVLVPIHDDEHDQRALEIFAENCPDREIVGINALPLLKQFGSLHCATLHIPENVIDTRSLIDESSINTTR